jgi:murein DD-endopeptidase MepM/ murein hydrolase activator NlpD
MIGPHIIGSVNLHFDRLRRWQPRLILVLDPSPDQIQILRQICPHSYLIGRVFRPDNEVENQIRTNPKAAANWAHQAIMSRFTPAIDAWQIENEVLQKWDGLPQLNEFALERMRIADVHGYKAAILGFSVGNPHLPDTDRMEHWRQVYPALEYAEQHNHVVVVHQYGSPTLQQPSPDWYIHRLEHKVLPLLTYSRVRFACTEFGIDNQINGFHSGPSGWRNVMNAQQYAQDLINMGKYLERYKDRMLGYAVFTLGNNAQWGSYDIDGEVADTLAAHYQLHPQPSVTPPPPPPPPPPPLSKFQKGDVVQTADFCRLRQPAGLNSETLGVFEPGFSAYVRGGPQTVDNLLWWNVVGVISGGQRLTGWTAQQNQQGIVLLQKPQGGPTNPLLAPFDGRYPITQLFGENPADYATFGLRGHNGLDLGAPTGTAIRAVDTGLAFQVENDPKGYGLFVKLRHDWGESLYAHLSDFAIQPGQHVTKGQIVGRSGSTGNSSGPHLHFALRISPYNMDDGWLGYGDPLLWLPSNCYVHPATDGVAPGPGPTLPPKPLTIERKLAPSFQVMHLEIKSLPVSASAQVVYMLKHLFTTHDGKWDVGERPAPYGIEQWARDAYLKPLGAPDYFDSAGGATHLFGALLGLDGQLIRNHPIRWWTRDEQIRHEMRTKQGSGWADMTMNADSAFSPGSGQSGPWCWAPDGAGECICGGGLPNQWHVSTFAVWQAIKR